MRRTAFVALALMISAGFGLLLSPAHADDSAPGGAAAPSAPVDLGNTKCPVTGKPVVPGITETVNNEVVHFCCTACAAKYKANPTAYTAALRADPAVARKMDAVDGAKAPVQDPAQKPADGLTPPPLVTPASMVTSDKGAELHDAMRRLWSDHVLWTRLFLVSAAGDMPDKDATTKRLLRNQEDIGNGIKTFYGADAATKLTALLKDHITVAADLIAALKAKDSAKTEDLKAKWSANADEIAAFLAKANPKSWPLEDAKSMMQEHLSLTTDEVSARLNKDWDADIAAYDKIHEQSMKMADMLSDGIRTQFPEKFQ